MFPTTFKPDRIILPFKASLRDTGQKLTLPQTTTLITRGDAERIRIERSHPGAPETIGWTIFEPTPRAYVHTGDPLYEAERDARRHIRPPYAIRHELDGDDTLTCSPLHL